MRRRSRRVSAGLAALLAATLAASSAAAVTIDWKGHTWQVTSGGMAGVCEGDPANVSIDPDGYLHLRLAKVGGDWKASEIFTTEELGFGTYQWHIDGPIDTYDKNVVLGLFPYGPAAGIGSDGTNEIDIEYSRWGVADGPNGDFTNYPASGTTIGELSYTFSLGGSTLSTSRFTWTTSSITSSLLGGLAAVGSNDELIQTFTYMPPNSAQNIPQQALPLGMNLWCFDAPPSDGEAVEIVVRDFTFVPEGAGVGGAGGMGGDSGIGDAGENATGGTAGAGKSGIGGATGAGRGGSGGSAGTGAAAGSSSAGANAGMSGAAGRIGSGGTSGVSAAAGRTGASGMPGGGIGANGGVGTTGGSASTGGPPKTSAGEASGCGCAVPRAEGNATGLGALVAAALTALRRRRRFSCRR